MLVEKGECQIDITNAIDGMAPRFFRVQGNRLPRRRIGISLKIGAEQKMAIVLVQCAVHVMLDYHFCYFLFVCPQIDNFAYLFSLPMTHRGRSV